MKFTFAEYHAHLLALHTDIESAIMDCPSDPNESPWVNDRPKELLGTALTALEDAMDCIGHSIQVQNETTPTGA